ncbi:hypothetical protein D6833_01035, partial [Candidatus Parcubacteria bacterium]
MLRSLVNPARRWCGDNVCRFDSYHDFDSPDVISPFDEVIVSLADGESVSLVCPYIGLPYLKRIISLSRYWRLLTDVEEWLRSQNRTQREKVYDFLVRYNARIRHCPRVHAKVVVSSRGALIGSANLTELGIRLRTEV